MVIEVDWNQYTSRLEGATGTNAQLLRGVVQGAVLDVGCGIGKHLSAFDKATLRVGIDVGLPGLRRGKLRFSNLTLICGNGYHIPFRTATFDSVTMIDVIEHLNEPSAALEETARVLKLSGVLFVQTPNYPIKRLYDFWHYVRGSRSKFQDDPTHVTKFSFSRLAAVVSQAGFEIDRATARNVFLDLYLPSLRRLRDTKIGLAIGQKVIIVARKRVDSHS
jgi:SAM-dependent methyltransferase